VRCGWCGSMMPSMPRGQRRSARWRRRSAAARRRCGSGLAGPSGTPAVRAAPASTSVSGSEPWRARFASSGRSTYQAELDRRSKPGSRSSTIAAPPPGSSRSAGCCRWLRRHGLPVSRVAPIRPRRRREPSAPPNCASISAVSSRRTSASTACASCGASSRRGRRALLRDPGGDSPGRVRSQTQPPPGNPVRFSHRRVRSRARGLQEPPPAPSAQTMPLCHLIRALSGARLTGAKSGTWGPARDSWRPG
jgi:hypothetical protein